MALFQGLKKPAGSSIQVFQAKQVFKTAGFLTENVHVWGSISVTIYNCQVCNHLKSQISIGLMSKLLAKLEKMGGYNFLRDGQFGPFF
jgi:hypothetical protein